MAPIADTEPHARGAGGFRRSLGVTEQIVQVYKYTRNSQSTNHEHVLRKEWRWRSQGHSNEIKKETET